MPTGAPGPWPGSPGRDGFFIWDHILFDPHGGIAISDPEGEGPFDVAFGGQTPGEDRSKGAEIVGRYAEAGVTWWVEDVAMWRFEPWEPWKAAYTWPVEEIEGRIRQGPPIV